MQPPDSAPLEPAEIERRLPLWIALSDLFLDTDVTPMLPYIARTIVEGGWSIEAAEAALRWEVRPAFYHNFLDVAGEWAGWPDAYVRERVLERRGTAGDVIGSDRFMPEEWRAVVAEVERLRRLS